MLRKIIFLYVLWKIIKKINIIKINYKVMHFQNFCIEELK